MVGRKYYWPSLKKEIEAYMKEYDIYLAFKAVRHKLYGDLQSLFILIHQWKDLLINFMTGLILSSDWKNNSYDSILVIVDCLTKMVHYKPIKVTINSARLAEVIIDVVVQYLINNRETIFISKFWFSLYYFLGIKWWLSTAFHF